MAKSKKKGNPLLFGLILLGGALMGLWKNEHRFDYHKAAAQTASVDTVTNLPAGELFSYTGKMDKDLTLKGHYVESFKGYLQVRCNAEIYAWERDEDDDGVSWSMTWMSRVESNQRNKDLKQRLRSSRIRPESYTVGQLSVLPDKIQFVDKKVRISPTKLQLNEKGKKLKLSPQREYFYLSSGGDSEKEVLGDERLSYIALRVPETASYFGKWNGASGEYHQAVKKEGMVSGMIQDKGILHHLVYGEREAALATLKSHIKRLKMIIRGIGLSVATAGGGMLFSGLTRFLIYIPFLGTHMTKVTGWIGMGVGFILGVLVLAVAVITSHPLVLIAFLLVITGGLFLLWKNYQKKRALVQGRLTQDLGHAPSTGELEELEFIKLWQLFASDGMISDEEKERLNKWSERHGMSKEKVEELTHKALEQSENNEHADPEKNLENLVQYTLADGKVDQHEMKTLQQAAAFIGLDKSALSSLIIKVQRA